MPCIKPVGDCALVVEFENEISVPVNYKVHTLDQRILAQNYPEVTETIPTYRTLIVYYRIGATTYEALKAKVEKLLEEPISTQCGGGMVIEIPLLYGGEVDVDDPSIRYDGWDGRETALDMEEIMAHEGLTREEVIRKHSENLHYVYFQSFAVGHSYLGCSAKTFSISRRENPRALIPTGTVAIWAGQTVLNGVDLPCGWQLIGRTPVDLYNEAKADPSYVHPGDWIKFVPITVAEYQRIHQEVLSGTYKKVTYPKEA